jgi:hypothetical protein
MTRTILMGLVVLASAAPVAAESPAGTFTCKGDTRGITVLAPAVAGGPMTVAVDGADSEHEATVFDMLSMVQVQFVDVIAGTSVELQLTAMADPAEATLTVRTMGGETVYETVACDDHDGLVSAVKAAAE